METRDVNGWEYTIVRSDDPNIIRQYAQEGWELVSVFPVSKNVMYGSQPGTKPNSMRWLRNPLTLVVVLVVLLSLFFTLVNMREYNTEIPISQVIQDAQTDRITRIVTTEAVIP